MEKITSKNNDIIKGVKKLFASPKERKAQGLFVLEGARLVFDVLNSFYKIKYFFITDEAFEKYTDKANDMIAKAENAYIITKDISSKLSETQSSQGIFAVCYMNDNSLQLESGKKYIALDNVQDPGNLGTIIRTAEALGINGVIISKGCDPYNPKVLRSSMGSILRMSIMDNDNLPAVLDMAKEKSLPLYATSPSASAKDITAVDFSNGAVCVIGNEANGVSQEVMDKCDELITIPMLGRAESLNASIAGAITMWEMLR